MEKYLNIRKEKLTKVIFIYLDKAMESEALQCILGHTPHFCPINSQHSITQVVICNVGGGQSRVLLCHRSAIKDEGGLENFGLLSDGYQRNLFSLLTKGGNELERPTLAKFVESSMFSVMNSREGELSCSKGLSQDTSGVTFP